ncbi:hypothetical protein BACOVA_00478 [Bacteroides ovatus ATCC 8483]|uniref:Uncharacterized protein n=1 Tax=Bacteroides ovatus (strain ATCC 8483 / DSM 1896 / JCM 5824 / BCRC 10623 / CCUG 4943 / NCTC 11153) TaxID=411476 RepID=A0AAN3ACD6_BACO1|nr:hypothetical protein BACOVA_00478 [Bacteroides ovatus ATCC 8483]
MRYRPCMETVIHSRIHAAVQYCAASLDVRIQAKRK